MRLRALDRSRAQTTGRCDFTLACLGFAPIFRRGLEELNEPSSKSRITGTLEMQGREIERPFENAMHEFDA